MFRTYTVIQKNYLTKKMRKKITRKRQEATNSKYKITSSQQNVESYREKTASNK